MNRAESKIAPFVISRDHREQLPWTFQGMVTDAKDGSVPIHVESHVEHRATGDYGILGMEGVALERKSLEDLYGTVGNGRDRFVAELQRLEQLQVAQVIVEATVADILQHPPHYSRLKPKFVLRSIIAWQQQFPRVHWWLVDSRRLAEVIAFRTLERFYRHAANRIPS